MDGKIFAITGAFAMFMPLINWYIKGYDWKEVPKSSSDDDNNSALIVIENMECYQLFPSLPFKDRMYGISAWGSGRSLALGAMLAGKTAEEAVHIAAKMDPFTGGDVISMGVG